MAAAETQREIHAEAAEDLLMQFHSLHNSTSFQHFLKISDDNKDLKSENEQLQTANKQNMKNISQLEQQISNMEEVQKNCASLQASLESANEAILTVNLDLKKSQEDVSDKQKKINTLEMELRSRNAQFSDEERRLNKELQSARENSSVKERELERLKSMTMEMKWPRYADLRATWAKISNDAFALVDAHFGSNLSVVNSKDMTTAYEKLSKLDARLKSLPLPTSNSPVAAQMRCAATLAVLWGLLTEHIFQPIYLFADDNELCSRLDELAKRDPAREEFFRSTLLGNFQPELKINGKKRREKVVNSMLDATAFLLPDKLGEYFRQALQRFCEQICGEWTLIQEVRARIKTSLMVNEVDKWRTLPFPLSESSPRSNGSLAALSRTEGAAAMNSQPEADSQNVVIVISPMMVIYGPSPSEEAIREPGFGLTQEQVAGAWKEQEERKRAERQNSRKVMKALSSPTRNNEDSRRSFLASGSRGTSQAG